MSSVSRLCSFSSLSAIFDIRMLHHPLNNFMIVIHLLLQIANEAGFGKSMFERLITLGCPKHLLNIQYRMHPGISYFPNSKFYSGSIIDAPIVRSKEYQKCYIPGQMFGSYSFINIIGGREEFDDYKRSRRNLVEAASVAMIISNLHKGIVLAFALFYVF